MFYSTTLRQSHSVHHSISLWDVIFLSTHSHKHHSMIYNRHANRERMKSPSGKAKKKKKKNNKKKEEARESSNESLLFLEE